SVDFDRAVAAGMGVTLPLGAALAGGIDRLVVLGVKASLSPADAAGRAAPPFRPPPFTPRRGVGPPRGAAPKTPPAAAPLSPRAGPRVPLPPPPIQAPPRASRSSAALPSRSPTATARCSRARSDCPPHLPRTSREAICASSRTRTR